MENAHSARTNPSEHVEFVYSDKYRINVYCENAKENDTIIQKRICASYFCRYKEKELQIISGSNYSKI